jgi:Flp pilus assembly protein TadD
MLGEWADAIADFTRVTELNDEHGLAHVARGTCYEHLNRFREAREDYVRASVLDGDTSWLSERIDYCERKIKYLDDH